MIGIGIILYTFDLDHLNTRAYAALAKKFVELNDQLYAKVVENVSGRILKKQTGELASQIYREVTIGQDTMLGEVGVRPESPKAWALEKGGKGYYAILPNKSHILHFYWGKLGKMVFLPSVNHPPSRKFGYLISALEEMRTLVPEEMDRALHQALGGR